MVGTRATNIYLTSGDAVSANVLSHHMPQMQLCEVLGCMAMKRFTCRTQLCKRNVCESHGQSHNKHSGPDVNWKQVITTPSSAILEVQRLPKCSIPECNED